MRYYIANSKETLDLLGIIRRIRTNSLEKRTLIATDVKSEPCEAYLYPELYELFVEQDRILQDAEYVTEEPNKNIFSLLKHGVGILKDDMSSAALTGLFILMSLAITGGANMELPTIAAALIAPLLCYFLFNSCLIAHLRLSRVQLLSFSLIGKTYKNKGLDLFLATLPPALLGFTLPWILSDYLGWKIWIFAALLIVPIMAYFLYLPVIIFDKEIGFKDALKLNHQAITQFGIGFFAQITILLGINLLVGPFVLLTLPITMLAIMQLYDDYFVDY
jgi:hypothetical protein